MNDQITAADFRAAMARLASAVTVVTTDGPAGRRGMPATAVTSVTDDPPNLLVCVNRSTRSNAMIKQNGVFAINVLSGPQEALLSSFAGPDADPFAQADLWHTLSSGSPLLRDTLTSLDCSLDQIINIGTHSLFVGRVIGATFGEAQASLVYFDRQFVSVPSSGPA